MHIHYSDVIMSVMVSQITSILIVCINLYSGADQITHLSSMSLAFVRGIHWWPVNSPHKGPVMQKMFPFDDIIMILCHILRFHSIYEIPHNNNFKTSVGINNKSCCAIVQYNKINLRLQHMHAHDGSFIRECLGLINESSGKNLR